MTESGRNGLADKSWLVDKFDLNLAVIAKHAGHSHPRTLRSIVKSCSLLRVCNSN